MPLDGIVMRAIAKELEQKICGGRIEKIYQPERDELLLCVHNNKQHYKLVISAAPSNPRVHLCSSVKENPATPPLFCMCLRKRIMSGRIVRVEQQGLDRVLSIYITSSNELGDVTEKCLVVELMGRHSNIILVDENKKIIDSIRHVDLTVSSVRLVLPNLIYEMPPKPSEKSEPLELSGEQILEKLMAIPSEMRADKALVEGFVGISPLVAREVVFRTTGFTAVSMMECDVSGLALHFSRLIQLVNSNSFSPCVLREEDKTTDFSAVEIEQYQGAVKVERASEISEAMEMFYTLRDNAERMRQRGRSLNKLATNALERAQKKMLIQQDILRDSANKDRYKIYGDLLTANLHRLLEGQKTAVVENYYDNNKTIEIPLMPELSPSKNAQRFYLRYRKAKTAETVAAGQIEQSIKEIAYLETVLHSIAQAENTQCLAEIRKELEECGYVKAAKTKANSKKSEQIKLMTVEGPMGYEILVGKNNRQNDYLTTRFSGAKDMWLHTKNIPGSHVVIKSKGDKDYPNQVIEYAAGIAAYFSKARNSAKVQVDYTHIKNVKKPNGAKPGYVIYEVYQTAYVAPMRIV